MLTTMAEAGDFRGLPCKRKLEQKSEPHSTKQKLCSGASPQKESLDVCDDDICSGLKDCIADGVALQITFDCGTALSSTALNVSDTCGNVVTCEDVKDTPHKQTKAENVRASTHISSISFEKPFSLSCSSPVDKSKVPQCLLHWDLHESTHIPSCETSTSVCSAVLACGSPSISGLHLDPVNLAKCNKGVETSKKRKNICYVNSCGVGDEILDKTSRGSDEQQSKICQDPEVLDYEHVEYKRCKSIKSDLYLCEFVRRRSKLGDSDVLQQQNEVVSDCSSSLVEVKSCNCSELTPLMSFNQIGTFKKEAAGTRMAEEINPDATCVEGHRRVIDPLSDVSTVTASSSVRSLEHAPGHADLCLMPKPATIDKDFEDFFSTLML